MSALDPKFTQSIEALLAFADTQDDAQRALIEEAVLKLFRTWVTRGQTPDKPAKRVDRHASHKDTRGDAEQKLSSLLRFGKFELAIVAHRIDVPLAKVLEMRSGNFYNAETVWILKTIERIQALVRNKQL